MLTLEERKQCIALLQERIEQLAEPIKKRWESLHDFASESGNDRFVSFSLFDDRGGEYIQVEYSLSTGELLYENFSREQFRNLGEL